MSNTLPYTIPERTQPGQQTIVPHLTIEWLDGGRIVVYQATDMSRELVDAWGDVAEHVLDHWPAGTPYLAIYDIVNPKVSLTPYFRKRVSDITQARPHLTGRSCAVLQNNFLTLILRNFVIRELNRNNPNLKRNLFFSREEALAWLRELL